MTMEGGLRLATPGGAMLADPHCLGNVLRSAGESLFDPAYWATRGELARVSAGRGSAWFISTGDRRWVLRHSRRGGLLARVLGDRYLWWGERRVRAFAEWQLLAELSRRGLPVPRPVAARYRRAGLVYRCDLITERLEDAEPLSALLGREQAGESLWAAVGQAIARLHTVGVDHADLNAHNILIHRTGAVSLIDFDRGRFRRPGSWSTSNLARLRRSLDKISRSWPAARFAERDWQALMTAYATAAATSPAAATD